MRFPFKMIPNSEFDVVGFGTNAVDFLIRVPEYPPFNSKIELSDYKQSAGGEVASTMVGLQRLGLKTAYAGRFGDDSAGRIGVDSLVAEAVDTDFAEVVENAQTQVAFIIIDERNGERTILWQRDKQLAYSVQDAPIDLAIRGRILHMTPHDTAACITMAATAKKAGVIVSLDVDNVFEGIEKLLPLVDICIVSADFAEKFVGLADPQSGLREISSRFGCAVTGTTLGSQGSVFLCQGEVIETRGFDIDGQCHDTTGAGDAFRAGLLFGILTGLSVQESATTANAVAALKCRGFGARSTLPNLQELHSLLKKK